MRRFSGGARARLTRVVAIAIAVLLVGIGVALAQEPASPAPEPDHHTMSMDMDTSHDMALKAGEGWHWSADANLFVGYNYQQRHFADFSAWESQNWGMLTVSHRLGRGRLTIQSMLSLEPFTVPAGGSPQLFQTGESYGGTPLVNFQHQHDLVMGLGATWVTTRSGVTVAAGADVVGSPTLGPSAFMHRESARDNPQVPLTHHFMDSTHISYGVLRGGVSRGGVTLEASAFRGEEPDEHRLDIEAPRLDSWAARARYDRGHWHAQVSAGHLHQPEWFEPYDLTRITASIGYEGTLRRRPLTVTAAWGGNREFNGFNGNADGYLLEWDLRVRPRSTVYGRAEVADKELFGLGLHPIGLSHRHVLYKVGALTTGYVFDVANTRWGRFGVGADATFYHMPDDLLVYWQGSHSYHAFLRWRPRASAPHTH